MGLSRVGSAPQLQSLIDATPGDATPPAVSSPTNAASYTGSTSKGTPVNVVKPCVLTLPPPSAREQKWILLQAQKILTERGVCICPVSLETYDYPVMLKCGHGLDENAARIIQQANPRLPCPKCREEALPDGPACKPNYDLIDVMRELGFPSHAANVSLSPKQQQLLRAFNQGDADAALALLRQMLPATRQATTNVFNNALTTAGSTPLHLAAWNGMYEIVKFLLNEGVDVNQGRTDDGVTPLYIAAENGHMNVVTALLQKEAINVNQGRTDCGVTPLYMAAQNGHMDVVAALLQSGANVNQATTHDGVTPLFMAVQNGHTDVVTALLQKEDINVNQGRTNDGVTPLFMAAQNGHTDVVTALLQKEDINVNQGRTNDGATPLYIASLNGHMDVVVALLEKGADVKQGRTDNGETPLQIAKRQGYRDIVKRLKESSHRPGWWWER